MSRYNVYSKHKVGDGPVGAETVLLLRIKFKLLKMKHRLLYLNF